MARRSTTSSSSSTSTTSLAQLQSLQAAEDGPKIRALLQNARDSWLPTAEAGVHYEVDHNDPTMNSTFDRCWAGFLKDRGGRVPRNYAEEIIPDMSTLTRDDGWKMPPTRHVPAPEAPTGRIYSAKAQVILRSATETRPDTSVVHAAVKPDGSVTWFVDCDVDDV